MARYGDIEAQSRYDFGAHQRNGAESEAEGVTQIRRDGTCSQTRRFVACFEPRLEALALEDKNATRNSSNLEILYVIP